MVNILLFLKSYSRSLETVQKYRHSRDLNVVSSDPSHALNHFFFLKCQFSWWIHPLSLFSRDEKRSPVSASRIPLTSVQQKQFQDLTSNKNAASNPISLLILLNFSRQEITWSGNREGSRQNIDEVKFSHKLLHCLQFTLKHSGTTCVTQRMSILI